MAQEVSAATQVSALLASSFHFIPPRCDALSLRRGGVSPLRFCIYFSQRGQMKRPRIVPVSGMVKSVCAVFIFSQRTSALLHCLLLVRLSPAVPSLSSEAMSNGISNS